MKRILPLLFWMTILPTYSAKYHFSSSDGVDSRTPAQAGNPATPWASLSKALDILQPGDSVLLKRGSNFRQNLRINNSGSAINEIYVGPYGTAAAPIINAAVTIDASAWGACTDPICSGLGIYQAVVGSAAITQLFIDGLPLTLAREPDQGYFTVRNYRIHSGDPTKGIITGDSISSIKDWQGATLHARIKWFNLLYETIDTVHQATKTFIIDKYLSAYQADSGGGFFINNKLGALDTPGEWFFKSFGSYGMLYLKTPSGDNPASHKVEGSIDGYNLDLKNTSYVRVEGLRLMYSADDAIDMTGAHHNTLIGNRIDFPQQMGMDLQGNDFNVTGNTVNGAMLAGIRLEPPSGLLTRSSFRDNTIKNTLQLKRVGKYAFFGNTIGGGIAMLIKGDSNFVSRNVVDSSGYGGITFSGRATIIEKNRVSNFCMVLDDGAGIYTEGKIPVVSRSQGAIVRNNFVLHSLGTTDGNYVPYTNAHGIYMDDSTRGVTVRDNIVYDTDVGIYLHNTDSISVLGNTVYGNKTYQLLLNRDISGEPMLGNLVQQNMLFSLFDTVPTRIESDMNSENANGTQFATYSQNDLCVEGSTWSCNTGAVTFTGSSRLAFRSKNIVERFSSGEWSRNQRAYLLKNTTDFTGGIVVSTRSGSNKLFTEQNMNSYPVNLGITTLKPLF